MLASKSPAHWWIPFQVWLPEASMNCTPRYATYPWRLSNKWEILYRCLRCPYSQPSHVLDPSCPLPLKLLIKGHLLNFQQQEAPPGLRHDRCGWYGVLGNSTMSGVKSRCWLVHAAWPTYDLSYNLSWRLPIQSAFFVGQKDSNSSSPSFFVSQKVQHPTGHMLVKQCHKHVDSWFLQPITMVMTWGWWILLLSPQAISPGCSNTGPTDPSRLHSRTTWKAIMDTVSDYHYD